jgi:hypothetical protein
MFRLAKHCLSLLLALPLAALADPISVTTRSTGSADPHPIVLDALGLDYWDYSGGPLPYELTISSVFDPAGSGYFDEGFRVSDYGSQVSLSLTLGADTFQFASEGATSVQAYSGWYSHEIWFDSPRPGSGKILFIANWLTGAPGLDSPPLTLHQLVTSEGNAQLDAMPSNPDAPGFWSMYGKADSVTLVTSPVPEPAPFGMLLGGVLVLGLWARLRHTSGSSLSKN